MNKRILVTFLTSFLLFLSLPQANAVDIPLLTWERGKEQNVVVGGVHAKDPWQVRLLKPGSPQITMKPSSVNRKGFLVYSATLPQDLPLGSYTIYVFGDGSVSGSQVAQVKVIALTRYNITEIPHDLVFLLLSFIFVITALSVTRSRKYTHFTFLRQRTLIETETLLFDKSVPRVIYPAYLLRAGALARLRPSVFKFLLLKDETFIHKTSPLLFALLPGLGLGLGLQGGLATHADLPNIPLYSLLAISILGLIDSYSGIFALLGFAMGQIVIGQTLSLRSTVVIFSLGLSWVCVGFISDLLYSSAEKDFLAKKRLSQTGPTKLVALVLISCVTGLFYYSTLLFTESLSIETKFQNNAFAVSSIAVGLVSGLKVILHQLLDWKITKNGKEKSLVIQEYKVARLLIPISTALIGFLGVFVGFIWTQNWAISFLIGLIIFAIFITFSYRFPFPKISLLRRWQRNVLIESALTTYFGYLLFIFIRTLPYQASLKSELFVLSALLLPLLHAIVGNLHDDIDEEIKANP